MMIINYFFFVFLIVDFLLGKVLMFLWLIVFILKCFNDKKKNLNKGEILV